VGTVIFVAI